MSDDERERAAPMTHRRPRYRFALVAVFAVMAGITLRARSRRSRETSGRLRDNLAVQLVSPAGAMPNELPLELVWHSVPTATEYDVTVLDKDSRQVVQRTTTDTTLTLGLDSALRRDVDYAWTVTAHLPGRVEQRSGATAFRLRAQ